MKNNLFYYATSELSQDAFICWLMSYACKDARVDKGLRQSALAFIKEWALNTEISNMPDDSIFVTDIKRQYKNIDVLITINDTYKIIIEDKTFSGNHSNQLNRYKNNLIEEGIPANNIIGILFKTGFVGDDKDIREADYIIFDRKKIISILEKNIGTISNDIYLNFYEYLTDLENQICKYQKKLVGEWDYLMIQGFYEYMYEIINNNPELEEWWGDYQYVANPSGGMYIYHLWPKNYLVNCKEVKTSMFIQVEFKNESINIAVRIGISRDESGKSLNNDIKRKIRDTFMYKDNGFLMSQFDMYRPNRISIGNTMNIAMVWNQYQKDKNYKEIEEALLDLMRKFNNIVEYFQNKLELSDL